MTKLSLMSDLSELSILIWEYTKKFPDNEKHSLTSQLKRAMVSVRLNIREGNVFVGKKKLQLFTIAFGSLNEVEECIIISHELKYINNSDKETFYNQYWLCLNKLKKLIHSIKLINSMN